MRIRYCGNAPTERTDADGRADDPNMKIAPNSAGFFVNGPWSFLDKNLVGTPFKDTADLYIADVRSDYKEKLAGFGLTFAPTEAGWGMVEGPANQMGPIPQNAWGFAYKLFAFDVDICLHAGGQPELEVREDRSVKRWTDATPAWTPVPQMSVTDEQIHRAVPPTYPVPKGGIMHNYALAKNSNPRAYYNYTVLFVDLAHIESYLEPVAGQNGWGREYQQETVTQRVFLRDKSASDPNAVLGSWTFEFTVGINEKGQDI